MADRSSRAGGPGAGPSGGGTRWLLIVGGAILVLLMALNSQKVTVHLIFTTIQMPLIFALLIAAVLGAIVGWAAPRLRRGRA